ncbi:MAG: hypothetical protein EXR27_10470 [Betaproteobacteria bacterium]|nr:hypothetical protein [Betaproteobacteria bacterium]
MPFFHSAGNVLELMGVLLKGATLVKAIAFEPLKMLNSGCERLPPGACPSLGGAQTGAEEYRTWQSRPITLAWRCGGERCWTTACRGGTLQETPQAPGQSGERCDRNAPVASCAGKLVLPFTHNYFNSYPVA